MKAVWFVGMYREKMENLNVALSIGIDAVRHDLDMGLMSSQDAAGQIIKILNEPLSELLEMDDADVDYKH